MVEFTYAATTVKTPSCFGMPARGHAFPTTPAQASRLAMPAVRERKAPLGVTGRVAATAGFKGGVDFVQTRIPGTPAWRPPSSS